MTGAVFEDPSKRYGAAVLNSGTFHDLGRYDSSEDAKQVRNSEYVSTWQAQCKHYTAYVLTC
jgi:hypothetical protein